MSLKITNNGPKASNQAEELVTDFFPYAREKLGFDKPVTLILQTDLKNASNPLGKTGSYDPNLSEITIYVDGRHPKDILRSFSHELIHHTQNCRGEFDNGTVAYEGYAQKDPHLRKMEEEAYLEGQMLLRDWEDSKKGEKTMNEETLKTLVKEVFTKAINKVLQEKTKTGREDRGGTEAQGTPSDRIKSLSEEVDEEEEVVEETADVSEDTITEEPEEEEETLKEWKKKTIFESLKLKWCK